MKFKIQMKDPDGVYESISDAIQTELAATGLPQDEQEALEDLKREKLNKLCRRWFRYGEYLTVEIDPEAETCVVVPNRDEP